MKKLIIFFIIIVAILCIIGLKYSSYLVEYKTIMSENSEYEKYKDKEIYGIELVTIINKAVDRNEKNKVEKTVEKVYIPNEEDSLQIDIYFIDDEQTYKMEAFYNTGMDDFKEIYRNVKFKCTKMEYHKKTGQICYIYIEQISI